MGWGRVRVGGMGRVRVGVRVGRLVGWLIDS